MIGILLTIVLLLLPFDSLRDDGAGSIELKKLNIHEVGHHNVRCGFSKKRRELRIEFIRCKNHGAGILRSIRALLSRLVFLLPGRAASTGSEEGCSHCYRK